MCVIIIKPAGVAMPDKEILRAAMTANPDGFGLVSPSVCYKGLDRGSFLRKLGKVSETEPCMIHLRWATHGSVKRANCHPFRADGVWFMHNGVLNIRTSGDMTDSETAFQRVIMPAIERCGFGSAGMAAAIESVIGTSRFALMKGDEILTFGNFYRSADGCLYSNLNFQRYLRPGVLRIV